MICLSVAISAFFSLMFSELPGSVVWCQTFGEILSHYCFTYFFCSFFLVFLLWIYYTFCSCSTGFSVLFFFFSLSVLEISIDTSSRSENLSSAMPSLLIGPSKAFFVSATVFLTLTFLFVFFFGFPSLCWHCHLFLHTVFFSHWSPYYINPSCLKFPVW